MWGGSHWRRPRGSDPIAPARHGGFDHPRAGGGSTGGWRHHGHAGAGDAAVANPRDSRRIFGITWITGMKKHGFVWKYGIFPMK